MKLHCSRLSMSNHHCALEQCTQPRWIQVNTSVVLWEHSSATTQRTVWRFLWSVRVSRWRRLSGNVLWLHSPAETHSVGHRLPGCHCHSRAPAGPGHIAERYRVRRACLLCSQRTSQTCHASRSLSSARKHQVCLGHPPVLASPLKKKKKKTKRRREMNAMFLCQGCITTAGCVLWSWKQEVGYSNSSVDKIKIWAMSLR